MTYKIFYFFWFFLMNCITIASNPSLDSLFNARTINLDHASLFSKVLSQDNQGRIKPFHTISSEILRKISRKQQLLDQNPVQIVLGMTIDPLLWQMAPIIKVTHEDILKLIEKDSHVAFVLIKKMNIY